MLFKYIQKLINKLKVSEKGQGMVEYALIIAFVAAIAIFALNGQLRNAVTGAFQKATTNVNDAAEKAGDTSGGTTSGGGATTGG